MMMPKKAVEQAQEFAKQVTEASRAVVMAHMHLDGRVELFFHGQAADAVFCSQMISGIQINKCLGIETASTASTAQEVSSEKV